MLAPLGSPPRVRGKARTPRRGHPPLGITPACAGKRLLRQLRHITSRDHPRVCGEKLRFRAVTGSQLGSPPRVRGKGHTDTPVVRDIGITPACAGKSAPWAVRPTSHRDHPRVCGEKRARDSTAYNAGGSPPRVRGKDGAHSRFHLDCGITPACAGKRQLSTACTWSDWDHPRVCGEKCPHEPAQSLIMGSPPRVRGKGHPMHPGPAYTGITPACAGKSSLACCPWRLHRDHPRVCGEKTGSRLLAALAPGSPPRVRGKGVMPTNIVTASGITPACAGKRLKRSHSIGHFSCILCLFHSVLHRASVSGGSRAGPCAPPCLPAQNAVPV